MKFTVTMKDPDALTDCIAGAARKEAHSLGLTDAESVAVQDAKMDVMQKAADRWFRYGEYLTVEIDTEANTCVVLQAKR